MSDTRQLLEIGKSAERDLQTRIAAVDELGLSGERELVGELTELLDRPKPGPEQASINWDPQAAERVVDLHLILALHRLGDDAQLQRMQSLVRQAGRMLPGREDELTNAALVIRQIGRLDLVKQVVELTGASEAQAVENAVRLLDGLKLPRPPVGGSVDSIPRLSEPMTFEIRTLKQEMETLVDLSRGSIVLSPGAKDFLAKNDYERGQVRRRDVTLAKVIEQDLQELNFAYCVDMQRVVICTYAEAGPRWRKWWEQYEDELGHEPKSNRFTLKSRP